MHPPLRLNIFYTLLDATSTRSVFSYSHMPPYHVPRLARLEAEVRVCMCALLCSSSLSLRSSASTKLFSVIPCFHRSASSLIFSAILSRFCVFWIINTIKNVTTVVAVLMTNCHASENPRIGPLTAHTAKVTNAIENVQGLPSNVEVLVVNLVNKSVVSCACVCDLDPDLGLPMTTMVDNVQNTHKNYRPKD